MLTGLSKSAGRQAAHYWGVSSAKEHNWAEVEQRHAESKTIALLGMDEEAALSSVTNTRYNKSLQVNFLQLVKGNTRMPLYSWLVVLKMKFFQFFLALQEQVSPTSHRQESQSYLLQKGSDHMEPAEELSPERVISMLINETVCSSSKMLQRIWHLKECIFCNSRQHFLKHAYTYPGTNHPLASQNSSLSNNSLFMCGPIGPWE